MAELEQAEWMSPSSPPPTASPGHSARDGKPPYR